MILGVTGTEKGGTKEQLSSFSVQVQILRPDVFHHGDCIGIDRQAFNIVYLYRGAFRRNVKLIAHPCDLRNKRAFTEYNDLVHPPKRPLKRNWDMAEDIERMIGIPYEDEEILRSGYWATMRYTLQLEKPVTVIWRDGTVEPWTSSKYL